MNRRKKQELKKTILIMVLAPLLIALVLFAIMDSRSARSGARSSKEQSSGSGLKDSGVETDGDKDGGGDAAHAPAKDGGSGGSKSSGQAGAEGKNEDGKSSGQGSNVVNPVDPVQEISFTAASEDTNELQRSIPVQIDAVILGGEAGTQVWALFLPAEMAAHPRILFSKYEKVSLEPLSEHLHPAIDGPENRDDAADGAGNGGAVTERREYSSEDEVTGLSGGSAFRVTMTSADGTVQSTDLYVFSCNDTASMYLDTESGSMETVDADLTKETTEQARFYIFRENGTLDSAGGCTVWGHGNSTWSRMKRPYNLKMEKKQSVLGMTECKKFSLLSNSFDSTNLLNRISTKLAMELGLRDVPEGEYVNLFLNGQYNGLYYLSQRPRTGGSVNISKLDDEILEANGISPESGEGSVTDGDFGDFADFGDGPGEDADGRDLSETGSESGQDAGISADPGEADGEGGSGNGESGESSGNSTDSDSGTLIPERVALHEDGSKQYRWAYKWEKEPRNNTGGYLLQQYEKYEGETAWFSTLHRRYRIMSPSYPTVGEVNYIADYMTAAERAIYSEDGTDPETGKHYDQFLDMNSWETMFLLEEFFVEWDAERWSFYITKDRNNPLLYCGPIWDFDHSAGTMIYGQYPETAVSMLMLRDTRHGWLNQLLSHDSFVKSLRKRWSKEISPVIHAYLDEKIEEEIRAIESSVYMNDIRRANYIFYRHEADALVKWLGRRLAFLDDYTGANGNKSASSNYMRVLFKFPWGDLSHYVKQGESLGYLPLPEYGEKQFESDTMNKKIIGWKDENGKEIDADVVINTDRVFEPVYEQ